MHKRQRRAKQIARDLKSQPVEQQPELPTQEKQDKAQVLTTCLLVLQQLPEGDDKNRFKEEIRKAIENAGGQEFIQTNYVPVDENKAKKLYKAVKEIAKNQWQDPGIFDNIAGFIMSTAQAIACGVAVYDHSIKREYSSATSATFAGSNGFANFYFMQDSLPRIIDGIGIYINELIKDKDPEVRKKALKALPKEIFALVCGIVATLIDESFVVDSRAAFGEGEINEAVYDSIVGISGAGMSLIYYDASKKLLDRFPTSKQEAEELQQGIKELFLGIEDVTTRNQRANQIKKAILNFSATSTTLAISLTKSGCFIYSTYANYVPNLGNLGSGIATALSALPSTCLAVFSALGAQKFFLKYMKDRWSSSGYTQQQDEEQGRAIRIVEQQPAQELESSKLLKVLTFGLNTLILAGFAASATGNASQARTNNDWLLFCCFYISLVTTARGYLAGIKGNDERRQEELVTQVLQRNLANGELDSLIRQLPNQTLETTPRADTPSVAALRSNTPTTSSPSSSPERARLNEGVVTQL